MTPSALRARASPAPVELFGPGVLVPDSVDAAAHSTAKFVTDRLGIDGRPLDLDLGMLREHIGLDPEVLAGRLREYGLHRTGVIAFLELSRTDASWAPFLDALRPTRTDVRVAEVLVALLRRDVGTHGNWISVRLCADTPTDALFGAFSRIRNAIRRRV